MSNERQEQSQASNENSNITTSKVSQEASWRKIWGQAQQAMQANEHLQAINYLSEIINSYLIEMTENDKSVVYYERGKLQFALLLIQQGVFSKRFRTGGEPSAGG